MPRSVTGTERTRLAADFNHHTRLEVVDALGVSQELSGFLGVNWLLGATGTEDQDQPVSSATFKLRKASVLPGGGTASLAPLRGDSPANNGGPLLWMNRAVRYREAITQPGLAPTSADWHTRFTGYITNVDWQTDETVITVTASDPGVKVGRKSITADKHYSDEHGTPLEQVLQQILDNEFRELAPPLVVPVSPNWMVRGFDIEQAYVLDALRNLALQIGWDIRYRYLGADDSPSLVLQEPNRGATTPDVVLPAGEYLKIPRHGVADTDVRNVVRVKYVDAGTGAVVPVEARDDASIDLYGERFMEIAEGASSNIDTYDEANAMAAAAVADLGQPYALADVDGLDLWFVQIGDLLALGANGDTFNATQVAAVQSIRWDHTEPGHPRVTYAVRGRPTAAYREWLNREGQGPTDGGPEGVIPLRLENFREVRRDDKGVTFGWDDGELATRCQEIWQWDTVLPEGDASERWPHFDPEGPDAANDAPTARLTPDTREVTILYPKLKEFDYTQLQPMDLELAPGDAERVTVAGVGNPPRFGKVSQTPSVSGLSVTLTVEVIDPQALGGTLSAWLNHDDVADATGTGAPEGTLVLDSTPRTVGGTDQFTIPSGLGTRALFSGIRVQPNRGKRVFLEFVNTRGIGTGIQPFNILPGDGGIINENGDLVDEAINAARQFVAGLTPPRVVSALPEDAAAAGFTAGELAVSATDGKLYTWTGSVWKPTINVEDLDGQLLATQIADAQITVAKFAAGIKPVRIIPNDAATGSDGDVAVDTSTGRLLRYTGGRWTDEVPAVSVTGALATAQLALASVTSAILAAKAVTETRIDDSAISTRTLAAASVVAGTLAAGAVTTPSRAAGSVTAVALAGGPITGDRIAANAITAANIAAHVITAGQIAAGAISTTELAALGVTAAKIAANTITAAQIAAKTITASQIAALTITAAEVATRSLTADKLVANSITAGEIAAGAITATAIQAKAVKATHLEISVLSDVKDAAGVSLGLGIIVSGKLTSVDGTRYVDVNAAGASAFLFHPAVALYANGNGLLGATLVVQGEVRSRFFTSTAGHELGGSVVFQTPAVLALMASVPVNVGVSWYSPASAPLYGNVAAFMRRDNAFGSTTLHVWSDSLIYMEPSVWVKGPLTAQGPLAVEPNQDFTIGSGGRLGVFGASALGKQTLNASKALRSSDQHIPAVDALIGIMANFGFYFDNSF